jgi:hypothetical protein
VATPRQRSDFAEVIELTNASHSSAWQYVGRLEKNVVDRITTSLSYTYSRVRDAETPIRVNTRGTIAWAAARPVSGRHDEITPGISSNNIPHRVVLTGMFASSQPRWRTELSLYYVGESGRPVTYLSWGTRRRGDLNADGSNANDPIYIPIDARDPDEIRFDGSAEEVTAQQTALEKMISTTRCLRAQRGQIMKRNSCREPWSNTTIASVKQAIPMRTRRIEAQLDVYNVLNALNRSWGHRREADPSLLEHMGQTTEPLQGSRSIFRFDTHGSRWDTNPSESTFQLQLALRYTF